MGKMQERMEAAEQDYADMYCQSDKTEQRVTGVRLRQDGPRHFDVLIDGGTALGQQLASSFGINKRLTRGELEGELEILCKEFHSQVIPSNEEVLALCHITLKEQMWELGS